MKRSYLTIEEKNKLLNLSLTAEILGDEYNCLFESEVRSKILDARQTIITAIENILKTNMTLDLIKKLHKELRGVRFVINRQGEPKKSERIINSFDLETVLEHSLVCCVNCTKNHKNCRLHEAFKRLVVPVADPDQKGCKYRIDKEKLNE